MEFEEVEFIYLIPNQKYKIKWEDIEYKGTFYIHNTVSDGIFAIFTQVHLKEVTLPYLYVKVYPDKQGTILRPIFKAHQRVVRRILRQTIGDPFFIEP